VVGQNRGKNLEQSTGEKEAGGPGRTHIEPLDAEAATQLFEILEDWNDQLKEIRPDIPEVSL
jgi:hypothetical protein